MDEATRVMAEGIFQAIQAEGDGYHFYLMAARSTEDPQGRKIFEQLAQEELSHIEYLRAQYRSLIETGKADPRLELGKRSDLSGLSPIFSPAIRERIGTAHFEMTALSVGMQLELSSQQFYREQAAAATDEVVRAFFTELAEWEAGHYAALSRQQAALKDDYWAANRFSPF
jgi:rubrerythrin